MRSPKGLPAAAGPRNGVRMKRLVRASWILPAALAAASPAAADVFSYVDPAVHGETSHWTWRTSLPDNTTFWTVTYFIDNHGGADAISPAMMDRIRDSARSWSFSGGSGALVELKEVFSDAADIHIHNTAIDGPGGILSQNFIAFSGHFATSSDGHTWHNIFAQASPRRALVEFDSAEPWFAGTGVPGGAQRDYWSRAVHELGHSIGLGTAGGAGFSVMREPLALGEMNRFQSPLDLEAVQHLYGNPEPATWALFGIGLGALGYARRRRRPGRAPDAGTRNSCRGAIMK